MMGPHFWCFQLCEVTLTLSLLSGPLWPRVAIPVGIPFRSVWANEVFTCLKWLWRYIFVLYIVKWSIIIQMFHVRFSDDDCSTPFFFCRLMLWILRIFLARCNNQQSTFLHILIYCFLLYIITMYIKEWSNGWKIYAYPFYMCESTSENQLNIQTIFLVSYHHMTFKPNHNHGFKSPLRSSSVIHIEWYLTVFFHPFNGLTY